MEIKTVELRQRLPPKGKKCVEFSLTLLSPTDKKSGQFLAQVTESAGKFLS